MKDSTTKYGENSSPASIGPGKRGFRGCRDHGYERGKEEMMAIYNPVIKVTQTMTFNVIISNGTDI